MMETEDLVESGRFGLCPTCNRTDGYVNVGKGHWFYCSAHRVYWFVGSNIFSSWKHQTEDEQRQIYNDTVAGFTKIET